MTEGGGVYTFGHGDYGRLGHGDEENQLAPRRVPAAGFNGERVVMVAAGGGHTVVLSEAGHVFTWGFGDSGSWGTAIGRTSWRRGRWRPGGSGARRSCLWRLGDCHTVAVTAGGRLYTWGKVGLVRCGLATGRHLFDRLVPTLVGAGAFGGSAVVMAACGQSTHTLVVTQDGALWACGRGSAGRLGLRRRR